MLRMKKMLLGIAAMVTLFCTCLICANAAEWDTCGIDSLYDPWGYIISGSDQRYLTEADVEGLSLQEINYAKNEIFARRGRKFSSLELQNYFGSKNWYEAVYEPEDFDGNYAAAIMNTYEKVNADFLAGVEHSIDPNGYQLDSGREEWQYKTGPATYDDILNEYRRALAENFSNMDEYQYIPIYFDPYFPYYKGEKVYYALYDFFNDGLPELIIANYQAATEDQDAYYSIRNVYGTDGKTVQRVDKGFGDGFNSYKFCANNILKAEWISGGLSAAGAAFFQMSPNAAAGEKIEAIGHNGYGECYRYDMQNYAEDEWIQPYVYKKIMASYQEVDIPFEWQEITI